MLSEEITSHRRGAGRRLGFVVSGPSGAGKNSVIEQVMKTIPDLAYSVSYTTRLPRHGEVDGVDYCYVSPRKFDRLIAEGELIEHVTYLGDRYGTARSQIEAVFARGEDVLLNIDVKGAKTVREKGLADFSPLFIFLTPSSLDRLSERLKGRGTENLREIQARLEVAAEEMEALPFFDYLVINDDLDQAVDELRGIILAERCRILRNHD